MKNLIISLIMTLVLILIFSIVCFPEDIPHIGSGPQYPGESGVAVPGKGADPAEIIIQAKAQQTEENKPTEEKQESAFRSDSDESGNESGGRMTERIVLQIIITRDKAVSFLCGVAAVLIAEIFVHRERKHNGKE